MKTVLSFLLFSCAGFSQTITKKYNEAYNRYDYYNQSGVKVGYDTYDSYTKTWKYYDVSQQYNNAYNRPPIDYGTPKSNVNIGLTKSVLSSKQAKYDANHKKIQDKINELSYSLGHMFTDKSTQYLADRFIKEYVNPLSKKSMDLSLEANTNSIIQYLNDGANKIIKEELIDK